MALQARTQGILTAAALGALLAIALLAGVALA